MCLWVVLYISGKRKTEVTGGVGKGVWGRSGNLDVGVLLKARVYLLEIVFV